MAGCFNKDIAACSSWDALYQEAFVVDPPMSSQWSFDPDFYGCSDLPWDHQTDPHADILSMLVELSDCFMAGAAGYELGPDISKEKKNFQDYAVQRPSRTQSSAMPTEFFTAETLSEATVESNSSASGKMGNRENRRSPSSSGVEKEKVPIMHLRRRAQNRASQQAFRERKQKYIRNLEHQLEELYENHQSLLQAYGKQVDEVSRLNSCIAELVAGSQAKELSLSDLAGFETSPDVFLTPLS